MIVASHDILEGDLIAINMPDGGQDLMSVDYVHWLDDRVAYDGFLLYSGTLTTAYAPFNMEVEVWANA